MHVVWFDNENTQKIRSTGSTVNVRFCFVIRSKVLV